jgi:hypothetical protein
VQGWEKVQGEEEELILVVQHGRFPELVMCNWGWGWGNHVFGADAGELLEDHLFDRPGPLCCFGVRPKTVVSATQAQNGKIEAIVDLVKIALINKGGACHIRSLADHVDGDMRARVRVNVRGNRLGDVVIAVRVGMLLGGTVGAVTIVPSSGTSSRRGGELRCRCGRQVLLGRRSAKGQGLRAEEV